MEIEVKQEVFDDETTNSDYDFHYPEYSSSNLQATVKKEELIIEDSKPYLHLYDEQEYNVNVFSIQFLDEENTKNADADSGSSDYEDYDYACEEGQVDGSNMEPSIVLEEHDVVIESNNCQSHIHKGKYRPTEEHKKTDYLLSRNCIRILCPVCGDKIKTFGDWSRHITQYHSSYTEDIKTNFVYHTYRKATCKLCNTVYHFHANHFLHYLTCHSPEDNKLFLCKICKHEDVNMTSIIKHMDDNHRKANDLFRKCPIPTCTRSFPDRTLMHEHFYDEHYEEFTTKFESYVCLLCNHPRFYKSLHFYEHLMNLHGLCDYNWEKLEFRQIIDDQETQFECIRCCKLYANPETHSLVEHYLTHENTFSWHCKYCHGKIAYTDSLHMCNRMYRFFNKTERPPKKKKRRLLAEPSLNQNKKGAIIQTHLWKKFESHILHVCPFCNHEFNDFQQWQLHLRKQHRINTLKGLNFSYVPDEPDRIFCRSCNAFVMKSCFDFHTHCFQHLPHMPYKCSKCSQTMANVEYALQHYQECWATVANSSDPLEPSSIPNEDEIPMFLDDELNWIEIYCTLCKTEFSSPEEIENHFKNHHNYFEENYMKSNNKLDMICRDCNTNIRSFSNDIYLSHYLSHIKDGPFKCMYCQRSYARLEICKRHVRRYHVLRSGRKLGSPTKPKIKLDISELKAASSNNSIPTDGQKENTGNFGLGTGTAKANILSEFENFIGYACAECNARFNDQVAWSEHIKTQHSFFNDSELSDVDGSTKKHKCKHCDLPLDSSISHRQKHKLTHMPYRSFVCTICDTRCNTLGLLYGHLRRKHFLKGTFECPICLVNLSTAYERSEHVNQTHPRSEWPHNMCLICYRKYSSLNAHMLCHDLNRPKHICSECGVGILNLNDLRKHMERKHNIKTEPEATVNDSAAEIVNESDDEDAPLAKIANKLKRPHKKNKITKQTKKTNNSSIS